jgi:hypothetical protein
LQLRAIRHVEKRQAVADARQPVREPRAPAARVVGHVGMHALGALRKRGLARAFRNAPAQPAVLAHPPQRERAEEREQHQQIDEGFGVVGAHRIVFSFDIFVMSATPITTDTTA